MNFSDSLFVIRWWFVFFLFGVAFFPLTLVFFRAFYDKGYIFAKIIGIALVSFAVFVLGIAHVYPFTRLFCVLVFVVLGISSYCLLFLKKNQRESLMTVFISSLKKKWAVYIFEELLFFATLYFWSYIRSFEPSIHGLEKFMDFGFVNSILRSEYFPPKDMWFPPLSINYYYFGHLITGVLTKLSDIPSNISFNLMIATLFALTFCQSFSLGLNLISPLLQKSPFSKVKTVLGGFLIAFLVTFAGNLHTIYTFFEKYSTENPQPFWQLHFSLSQFPNAYWYPNATRFIYNTIHEFPIYSFVVSDLHGHVLDIPFVLLLLALLLNILLMKSLKTYYLLLISFLLAVMYMTNAWDGIIYFLLTALVVLYLQWQKINHWEIDLFIGLFVYLFIIGVGFTVFSLPFNLFFKPFVSGIGVLCAPKFLTDIGHMGPFLFEPNHCQKSPLWQLMILYGFFYFWVIPFFLFFFKKKNPVEIFISLLIILSTALIILPEFIYVKDIYPAHYRANTMFKLVYQSFIMLSFVSGYTIIRSIGYLSAGWRIKIGNLILILIGSIGLFLVAIYPYFAIHSYYKDIKTQESLDGTVYLKPLYPTDYEAIGWIVKNIKGQPIILEAQGDSYTDYARVSANTGLPTVLGWTVHEWLWRGTYDIPAPRISDVQTLYETSDIQIAKQLIKKYAVKYVFIGDLERQKYSKLYENTFKTLGKLVFQRGSTRIYALNPTTF